MSAVAPVSFFFKKDFLQLFGFLILVFLVFVFFLLPTKSPISLDNEIIR